MKHKLNLFLPLVVALAMVIGMAIGFKLREDSITPTFFFQNELPASMNEIARIVEQNYVTPIDKNVTYGDAVNAYLAQLDPYSKYLSPLEAQVYDEEMVGNFKGIGIDYEYINDTLNIMNLTTNGASEKAGVKIGDKFVRINDINLVKSSLDFRATLRQEIKKSKTVQFTVVRNAKTIQIPVTAAVIPLPSVGIAYAITPDCGFIKLLKFSETSYKEFMDATEMLQQKGCKRLIVDLRGNTGGIVEQAFQIASEFFEAEKLIFSTINKTETKAFKSIRDGFLKDIPLTLIVDQSTASSSEIFAGVMQDYGRAKVVGRTTVGKSLVQNVFRLHNGGAIKLSTAKYLTPLGRDIQKRKDSTVSIKTYKNKLGETLYSNSGIVPSIVVPFDSTNYPTSVTNFYLKGILAQYVYTYYINHSAIMHQYKTPADFAAQYQVPKELWSHIVDFAKQHQIDLNNISPEAQKTILNKFKSFLARQIWRNEGYFIAENSTDDIIKVAINLVK